MEGAISHYREDPPKGEFVIVIEGKAIDEIRREERLSWEEMTLEDHMDFYENQGISRKEAMKLVAKDRGVSRREIYQQLLKTDD